MPPIEGYADVAETSIAEAEVEVGGGASGRVSTSTSERMPGALLLLPLLLLI